MTEIDESHLATANSSNNTLTTASYDCLQIKKLIKWVNIYILEASYKLRHI